MYFFAQIYGLAGRAENDTPKTAFEVHVGVRRIKTSPTLVGPVVTYSKSLYLDVRLVPQGAAAGDRIDASLKQTH